MPIEVELPDGSIAEFPDGTPDDVMKRALSKVVQPKSKSWLDVPGEALGNIPSSAAKFASDVVQPFLQPVETAKAIGNLGYGLGSKAAGAIGIQQDPAKKAENEAAANAVGKFFVDRYGSMDALKETIAKDPVGFAGDLSLALTGGAALPARAPGVVGQAARATQAVGRAVDPLAMAGKAAAGTVKGVAPILGVTAGTGAEPIREAFRAGKEGRTAFAENMRGRGDVNEIVAMAKSAVADMGKERSSAYKAGIASTKESNVTLPMLPVVNALEKALNEVTFNGVSKNDDAVRAIGKAAEKIQEFRNLPREVRRTPEAFDAMKQGVGGILEKLEKGSTEHRAVGGIYNAIKDEIVSKVPEYAKTMADYSKATEQINEVGRTLSVNGRATNDTALRKLGSTMRNNVNTNFGARTKLVDELNKYEPDLKPSLAGQSMNDWAPRGIARVGAGMGLINAGATLNPMALAMMPLASPRVIGEAAYGLGKGAKVATDIGSAVGSDAIMKALMAAYMGGNAARPLQGQ